MTPPIKDRRLYVAVDNHAILTAYQHDYTAAAQAARAWRGVVAELPIVADYRDDIPDQPMPHWQDTGTGTIGEALPVRPIELTGYHHEKNGQLVIEYRLVEYDDSAG